jgi:hypothetical protein
MHAMHSTLARLSRCLAYTVAAVLMLRAVPLWATGDPLSLSAQPGQWSERLFIDQPAGTLRATQAASFAYGSDAAMGGYIAIGPWHAGSYGARLEYKTAYASSQGTVKGYYRTRGLLPFQAGVTVEYRQGRNSLAKRVYHLAPASEWRPFDIPVRHPPRTADAFSVAFGLTDHTEGQVEFARLTISPGVADLSFPAQPVPLTRPLPRQAFPAAQTFRLRKDANTFWFATPEGRPYFSIATVGPDARESGLPSRSGSQWARYLQELGFNSLAGWTSLGFWLDTNNALAAAKDRPLPLFVTLESSSLKGGFDWLTDAQGRTGIAGHAFPDPFDPAFAAAYRQEAARIGLMLGGKRWLAGWFADNELDHADLWRRVYSPHCARAFKAFLVDRYASIDVLNAKWDTHYASFDALMAARPDPLLPLGPMAQDFRLFSRVVVARYIDLTIDAIRSADPLRPIFSNRFMSSGAGATSAYLDLYAKYDGIAVNLYPQNLHAGLDNNELAFLRHFHGRTGKPILISEWSVPAVDSGLYDAASDSLDWSWGQVVGTQAERAAQAATVARDLYNLPFVVGAHWFALRDFRGERYANRGLFKADGEAWQQLVDALQKTNHELAAAHAH